LQSIVIQRVEGGYLESHRRILPTPIPGWRPALPIVRGIRDKNGLAAKGNWVIDRTILHSRGFSPISHCPPSSKERGVGGYLVHSSRLIPRRISFVLTPIVMSPRLKMQGFVVQRTFLGRSRACRLNASCGQTACGETTSLTCGTSRICGSVRFRRRAEIWSLKRDSIVGGCPAGIWMLPFCIPGCASSRKGPI
jgi:hypothetical protein